MNTLGITIEDSDLIPFEQFGLAWRFTDTKHNLLPEADLQLIKPIIQPKAFALCEAIAPLIIDYCQFSNLVNFKTSCDTSMNVQNWLNSLSISNEQLLCISWDKENAVVTNWGCFIKYWDDFCYPSSDDVIILPFEGSWIIYYCHTVEFLMGQIE